MNKYRKQQKIVIITIHFAIEKQWIRDLLLLLLLLLLSTEVGISFLFRFYLIVKSSSHAVNGGIFAFDISLVISQIMPILFLFSYDFGYAIYFGSLRFASDSLLSVFYYYSTSDALLCISLKLESNQKSIL